MTVTTHNGELTGLLLEHDELNDCWYLVAIYDGCQVEIRLDNTQEAVEERLLDALAEIKAKKEITA